MVFYARGHRTGTITTASAVMRDLSFGMKRTYKDNSKQEPLTQAN